ncbi:CLUMA_CG015187, isoform E [Clunio marinus]|uniref:CLUMA_CG015187, isoform E n=1 Tax=Clunio marinus TaxID=568069 RepID=A0A1J1IVA9_9DIPT|nr:CLUMA_CG015187, isoform E [Clunio marinus]
MIPKVLLYVQNYSMLLANLFIYKHHVTYSTNNSKKNEFHLLAFFCLPKQHMFDSYKKIEEHKSV